MASTITAQELRHHWITGLEIALVDVREEGPYADAHPLFAVSVPVSEIEEKLPLLIPRLSAPIVVYDDGEGYTERAVFRISTLGFSNVSVLEGGLSAYRSVGEVYRDVNVPSKAFGELVESIRHTPSLSADEVRAVLDREDDVVVVDARRFEEFNTMSIPRGRSCPGGELVYRLHGSTLSPNSLVIVNCAGRTRSIIGTQSLINSGISNKVVALRNGTIGWTLADLDLDREKTERMPKPTDENLLQAKARVKRWADHVGVPIISGEKLIQFRSEVATRTLYNLDVRDPEEYTLWHPPGFTSAPGGQLVQATDEWVGVRGARIVLYDNDGVRARMAGSWLFQMGWDVYVLDDKVEVPDPELYFHTLGWDGHVPGGSSITVNDLQNANDVTVIDLARSPTYRKGHIPGAWFASGQELARDIYAAPGDNTIVLTSPDGEVAAANAPDALMAGAREVRYLSGGTAAWTAAGLPLETETRWLSEPIDVYKRPYEGTDNAKANMQNYIDWELQLVAQLANDGVAGFHVARAPE